MGLPRLICLLLLASCFCCRRAAGVPEEAEQPAPKPAPELLEVEMGSTALLKCGPSHSQGNLSLDWFAIHKEKQALIYRVRRGQSQPEPGEYQHRLSLHGGGPTLALADVTPYDERTIFLCHSKRPHSKEHRIQLQVYKAPEEPSIQANTVGISVNSKELTEIATCVGRNGYPIPQVTWYKNRVPLKEEINNTHIQSSQIVESSGLYTLHSILKARVVKEDKDAHFYCELSYRLPSGNHMKESKDVTVPVFYPVERVWLEVMPTGMLKEGDRVEIRCFADSNPPPHFSISKQNFITMEMEEEVTDHNGLLVLEPAQKEHSGLYECQSLDLETMGILSDQQKLLVNYVSDVHVSPATPEGQEGSNLTLTCEAESNQALEYHWLREKTGKVLEKGPVLRLYNLKLEAGGSYLCMASVPSVPGLNRTQLVHVAVYGAPRMALKEKKLQVKENEVTSLTCEASGYPRPSISWNINGTAHEQGENPQHVLSTLNVLVTPGLLETGVECVASNSLGKNTTLIFLELAYLTTLTPDSNTTTTTGFSTSTHISTSTASPHARANHTSTEKKLPQPESQGVIIVAVIVSILVLAVLGAVLYFFYKKGKLPCGRSGKQEIPVVSHTIPFLDLTLVQSTILPNGPAASLARVANLWPPSASTLPPPRKSEIVVEVKSEKCSEEMGLLQSSSSDKRAPGDQLVNSKPAV